MVSFKTLFILTTVLCLTVNYSTAEESAKESQKTKTVKDKPEHTSESDSDDERSDSDDTKELKKSSEEKQLDSGDYRSSADHHGSSSDDKKDASKDEQPHSQDKKSNSVKKSEHDDDDRAKSGSDRSDSERHQEDDDDDDDDDDDEQAKKSDEKSDVDLNQRRNDGIDKKPTGEVLQNLRKIVQIMKSQKRKHKKRKHRKIYYTYAMHMKDIKSKILTSVGVLQQTRYQQAGIRLTRDLLQAALKNMLSTGLPKNCNKLSISSSCYKSVKIRLAKTCHLQNCYKLLKQLAASLWITSFDKSTCNRLVVNKLSQAMQTHPDIGLLITNLLQDVN